MKRLNFLLVSFLICSPVFAGYQKTYNPESGMGDFVGINASRDVAIICDSGNTLTTTGSGTWACGVGGGSPGGSSTQLQYNNAGAFGGITNYTSNGTNVILLDDATFGLGVGKGLIEFDDQATDEVNILNASVGIGTSTPSYNLTLKGTTSNTSLVNLMVTDSADRKRFSIRNDGLAAFSSGTGDPALSSVIAPLTLFATNTNGYTTGFATNHGTILLEETGDGPETTSGIELQNSGAGSGYGYKIYTNNTNDYLGIGVRYSSATWTNAITLKQQTGNVGIGTTNPGYKLEVNGGTLGVVSAARYWTVTKDSTLATIDTNDKHVFQTDASNRATINDGGLSVGSTFYSTNAPANGAIIQGLTGIATTAPDKQVEINSATGVNLRLTYNDADGSAANYSDFSMSSGGDLTIYPSGGDTNITGNVTPTGRVTKRVVTVSDATSITPNSDTTDICYQLNTQAVGTLTINAPSGSPVVGQALVIKIKSTNIQTFSWNATYNASISAALPTASTGSSKFDYISFIYNDVNSKWDITGYGMGNS